MVDVKNLKVTNDDQNVLKDHNRPLGPVDIDRKTFPDQPAHGDGVLCTVDNVRHLLRENAIVVRYNVIKKRTEIAVPWVADRSENADSVSMTHIQSLASRCAMPTGLVPAFTEAIGEECSYNPVADWIRGKPWDGVDRLVSICETIEPTHGYPLPLRDVLVTKWLLSATAAALLPAGFRSRGVLTLQGPQSMGKTSWGLRLINDDVLRSKVIKVDHHLDAGNKDSQLGAIDHWIVEIGELESSFRRDVSRLKGFLTSGADKIRRPYGRVTVEYQRRTVFYATVNSNDFLVDPTGNVRWWTIPCERIDYGHDIDMQQVFAQLAVEFEAGAEWWLTAEEERRLEEKNGHHRSFSVVQDRLAAIIDFNDTEFSNHQALTASEVLHAAGMERPTNGQAKEAAGLLREWFGGSKRINGRDKWRVPLRRELHQLNLPADEIKLKSKFD